MADADEYSSSSSSNWDPPADEGAGEGGAAMDMSQFEGHDRYADLEQKERELAGEQVLMIFALPDGGRASGSFPHGQTVQFVKIWLEENHGVDYERQTLKLDGQVLIDPLSLNDIPGFKTGGVENTVLVEA
eukprot:TRINITY_DN27196_c0_g1_i1.p1 TRINITY_DN27196_c0_g1~~TRINITY_DN27196_c0_g1_i1.p1  ORF type:complete len:131 (+),score=62.34 TRINITY_DN27196_c0_g1_i1:65-457(+)